MKEAFKEVAKDILKTFAQDFMKEAAKEVLNKITKATSDDSKIDMIKASKKLVARKLIKQTTKSPHKNSTNISKENVNDVNDTEATKNSLFSNEITTVVDEVAELS